MSLFVKIAKQFRKPTGVLGNIAGLIMSKRTSNIERNELGVSLLDIEPQDNILEIGFGPGIAIEQMNKLAVNGTVYGIDHSELMTNKALIRNSKAVSNGKVRLSTTSVSNLPQFEHSIDKVLDVNSFQFWDDKVNNLKKLKEQMSSKATILLVHQPRNPNASEHDSTKAGFKFSNYLEEAGFTNIRFEKKEMKPVSTVFVFGTTE